MKCVSFYLASVLVSVFVLVQYSSGSSGLDPGCSHNFVDGELSDYDALLFRTEIRKTGATRLGFGIKTIEEVKFPPTSSTNSAFITSVRVFDLYTNGTGGHVDKVTYTENRLGVTLRLKSEKGKGYRFLIEIYGRN